MTESQRSNALNIINGEESIVSNLFEVNGEIKSGVLEDLELSKKRHFSANSILKSQQINEELSNINDLDRLDSDLERITQLFNEESEGLLKEVFYVNRKIFEEVAENIWQEAKERIGGEAANV